MQINATNNLTPAPVPPRRVAAQAGPSGAEADFGSAEAVSRQLRDTPNKRIDEIERARLQLNQHYPPDETVRRIANLLAVHIKSVE